MAENAHHDDAYFQIGEAADRTGLTQRTLRYYEEKGLLPPPSRMEGGFRLYSEADIQRLERIKELKDLLGFSLADIREMLDADEVRLQLRNEWRSYAADTEKAPKLRVARELTATQLRLVEEKMAKMATLRDELRTRLLRYDAWLSEHAPEAEREPAEVG
jgi:DNA-binding transcriptional MerR regulator